MVERSRQNRSHLLLSILKSFASTLVCIRIHFCKKSPDLPLSFASTSETHTRLEGSEAETYLQLVSLPQTSSFLNSSGRSAGSPRKKGPSKKSNLLNTCFLLIFEERMIYLLAA